MGRIVARVRITNQRMVRGEVCGPVEIKIEGFEPVYSEVLFLDMEPQDGVFEPLIGYIVLEQAQATVDMLGHRLIHVKKTDLKQDLLPSRRYFQPEPRIWERDFARLFRTDSSGREMVIFSWPFSSFSRH
jgi:hypothetical protein